MPKKYLSKEEEEIAVSELKNLIHVYTLPEMIREAIKRNKWQPENYSVMIDGEIYSLEDSLKRYENNTATELDLKVIKQVLEVPKIKRRIDRDFGNVITKSISEKNKELKKGMSLEQKLAQKEAELEKIEKKEVKPENDRPRTIDFDDE